MQDPSKATSVARTSVTSRRQPSLSAVADQQGLPRCRELVRSSGLTAAHRRAADEHRETRGSTDSRMLPSMPPWRRSASRGRQPSESVYSRARTPDLRSRAPSQSPKLPSRSPKLPSRSPKLPSWSPKPPSRSPKRRRVANQAETQPLRFISACPPRSQEASMPPPRDSIPARDRPMCYMLPTSKSRPAPPHWVRRRRSRSQPLPERLPM